MPPLIMELVVGACKGELLMEVIVELSKYASCHVKTFIIDGKEADLDDFVKGDLLRSDENGSN